MIYELLNCVIGMIHFSPINGEILVKALVQNIITFNHTVILCL